MQSEIFWPCIYVNNKNGNSKIKGPYIEVHKHSRAPVIHLVIIL